MFLAALFTIAKIWEQPKCQSMDERVKKTWCVYLYIYTHNGKLLSYKKEHLSENMDGPRDYHTK